MQECRVSLAWCPPAHLTVGPHSRSPYNCIVQSGECDEVSQRDGGSGKARPAQEPIVDLLQPLLRQGRELGVPQGQPLRDLRTRATPG